MSQKKTIPPVIPDFSDGFSVALRLWLLFLLALFFLGYPVPFSILVGAVGGFSGGWIFAWWKAKDEPVKIESEAVEDSEEIIVKSMSGLALAKQRRDAKKLPKPKKGSPQRSLTALAGLLKR